MDPKLLPCKNQSSRENAGGRVVNKIWASDRGAGTTQVHPCRCQGFEPKIARSSCIQNNNNLKPVFIMANFLI